MMPRCRPSSSGGLLKGSLGAPYLRCRWPEPLSVSIVAYTLAVVAWWGLQVNSLDARVLALTQDLDLLSRTNSARDDHQDTNITQLKQAVEDKTGCTEQLTTLERELKADLEALNNSFKLLKAHQESCACAAPQPLSFVNGNTPYPTDWTSAWTVSDSGRTAAFTDTTPAGGSGHGTIWSNGAKNSGTFL